MKKYRLYQVDSFTKTKFTGNLAGVVLNNVIVSRTEIEL